MKAFLTSLILAVVLLCGCFEKPGFPDSNEIIQDTGGCTGTCLEMSGVAQAGCGPDVVISTGKYNENSKTWWYDLNQYKEGCNPACVVDEATRSATINWRCTGAIPP